MTNTTTHTTSQALTLVKHIVRTSTRKQAIKLLMKAGMNTKQANSCYDKYQRKEILVGCAKGKPTLNTTNKVNKKLADNRALYIPEHELLLTNTDRELDKEYNRRIAKQRKQDNERDVIVEHVTNRNTKVYRKPCTFKSF